MRCEGCATTWYSRVATLIVAQDDLARCVKCGGMLRLAAEPSAPVRHDGAASLPLR